MSPIDPNSPAFPLTEDAVKDFPMQGISIRALIAKDLMVGLLANSFYAQSPHTDAEGAAQTAILYTDELIAQLNK